MNHFHNSRNTWGLILILIFVFTALTAFPVAANQADFNSAAQVAPTATFSSSTVIATVKSGTEDSINVRSGPDIDYQLLGRLLAGEQVRALGRSPGGDWVKIAYSQSPDGTGWVYAYLIELNGTLPIVEPPPTPTPLVTATLDKTLAAQFIIEQPPTRQPTFTPPPPLSIPTFTPPPAAPNPLRPEFVYIILGIGALGLVGVIASFLNKRR